VVAARQSPQVTQEDEHGGMPVLKEFLQRTMTAVEIRERETWGSVAWREPGEE
jgi:hypothetical protein